MVRIWCLFSSEWPLSRCGFCTAFVRDDGRVATSFCNAPVLRSFAMTAGWLRRFPILRTASFRFAILVLRSFCDAPSAASFRDAPSAASFRDAPSPPSEDDDECVVVVVVVVVVWSTDDGQTSFLFF